MAKNCDNCINSGRPSYEYPCTVCETAYGSAPSKWEGVVPATADMVEVVRCKKCINGIYDESNNIYKCVKSTNYDPEYNDWFGFVSYHNADYYCADGERRTDA